MICLFSLFPSLRRPPHVERFTCNWRGPGKYFQSQLTCGGAKRKAAGFAVHKRFSQPPLFSWYNTTHHLPCCSAGSKDAVNPFIFRSRDGKFSESRESSPGSSPCKCKNRAWRRAARIGESRCDDKARRGDTGLLSTGACSKGANDDITTERLQIFAHASVEDSRIDF